MRAKLKDLVKGQVFKFDNYDPATYMCSVVVGKQSYVSLPSGSLKIVDMQFGDNTEEVTVLDVDTYVIFQVKH